MTNTINLISNKTVKKVIEFPVEESKHLKIKPNNYMIENVDEYNFLLHRELSNNEINIFKAEEMFQYEGKTYLAVLANFPSEEEVLRAIHSYWNAIKQLNSCT